MIPPDREAVELQALVGRWFKVYDVTVRGEVMALHVQVNIASLENDFEALRLELTGRGFIPFITKEKGEHLLYLQRKPPPRYWSSKVNLVLLVVTVLTTSFAGALLWADYDKKASLDADATLNGIVFFTVPLLLILGIHEMGHYLVARRYKVAASLPFFIPSVPPLGTFGAMISMREPIPTRRALMDIGAAGPLFGFAVAVPVTLAGLLLTNADPRAASVNTGGQGVIQLPLFFNLLEYFVPLPPDATVHPTLFAGWVGIFVTAMNLLPAGQLDGGHIARALLGERAKYASYAAVALMMLLSFLGYFGWSIIALFIVFLGIRHPPPLNDLVPLDRRRMLVGFVAVAVLFTSFVPVPFSNIPEDPELQFRYPAQGGDTLTTLALNFTAGQNRTEDFVVANVGNVLLEVTLRLEGNETLETYNWTVELTGAYVEGNLTRPGERIGGQVRFRFNATEHVVVGLLVRVPTDAPVGNYTFSIQTSVRAILGGETFPVGSDLLGVTRLDVELAVV